MLTPVQYLCLTGSICLMSGRKRSTYWATFMIVSVGAYPQVSIAVWYPRALEAMRIDRVASGWARTSPPESVMPPPDMR